MVDEQCGTDAKPRVSKCNSCSFELNGRRQIWYSSFPIEMNLAQEQSHQKILRKLRYKFAQKVQQLREELLLEDSSSQKNIKF
jgi:hypothetical protein